MVEQVRRERRTVGRAATGAGHPLPQVSAVAPPVTAQRERHRRRSLPVKPGPKQSSPAGTRGGPVTSPRGARAGLMLGDHRPIKPRRITVGGLVLALCMSGLLPTAALRAQQLEPRAYAPSPVGLNVAVIADAVSTGDLSFDPSIPITNGHANLNIAATGYVRTLDLFGRSANVGIGVPYVRGDLDGLYLGQYVAAHRSAFADPSLRLAINLYGAPAMTPREFAAYHEQTIVGTSLTIIAPLGAYDSTKLVNVGTNRWAFKPELGVSRAIGAWTLEGDLAVWAFTDNTNFYNGKTRSQEPIGALQWHVIYTIRPRLWIAVDSTYYNGGRTTIDGKRNFDLQQNSRVGITLAVPLGRQQTVKVAYSKGARTSIGGDFETIGVSYSYVWADRR